MLRLKGLWRSAERTSDVWKPLTGIQFKATPVQIGNGGNGELWTSFSCWMLSCLLDAADGAFRSLWCGCRCGCRSNFEIISAYSAGLVLTLSIWIGALMPVFLLLNADHLGDDLEFFTALELHFLWRCSRNDAKSLLALRRRADGHGVVVWIPSRVIIIWCSIYFHIGFVDSRCLWSLLCVCLQLIADILKITEGRAFAWNELVKRRCHGCVFHQL